MICGGRHLAHRAVVCEDVVRVTRQRCRLQRPTCIMLPVQRDLYGVLLRGSVVHPSGMTLEGMRLVNIKLNRSDEQ